MVTIMFYLALCVSRKYIFLVKFKTVTSVVLSLYQSFVGGVTVAGQAVNHGVSVAGPASVGPWPG